MWYNVNSKSESHHWKKIRHVTRNSHFQLEFATILDESSAPSKSALYNRPSDEPALVLLNSKKKK